MAARAATRRGLVTAGLLLPALLFLAFWFVLPLGELLVLSFSDKRGAFAAYAELLEGEVYRRVFLNTLVLGAGVTFACVLLAYPTAYVLTRLRGACAGYLAFCCVLLPFWISVLVRTFAWMLLLETQRPGEPPPRRQRPRSTRPCRSSSTTTGVLSAWCTCCCPTRCCRSTRRWRGSTRALLRASEGLGASPAHDLPPRLLPAVAARRGDGGDLRLPAVPRLLHHAGAARRRRAA